LGGQGDRLDQRVQALGHVHRMQSPDIADHKSVRRQSAGRPRLRFGRQAVEAGRANAVVGHQDARRAQFAHVPGQIAGDGHHVRAPRQQPLQSPPQPRMVHLMHFVDQRRARAQQSQRRADEQVARVEQVGALKGQPGQDRQQVGERLHQKGDGIAREQREQVQAGQAREGKGAPHPVVIPQRADGAQVARVEAARRGQRHGVPGVGQRLAHLHDLQAMRLLSRQAVIAQVDQARLSHAPPPRPSASR